VSNLRSFIEAAAKPFSNVAPFHSGIPKSLKTPLYLLRGIADNPKKPPVLQKPPIPRFPSRHLGKNLDAAPGTAGMRT